LLISRLSIFFNAIFTFLPLFSRSSGLSLSTIYLFPVVHYIKHGGKFFWILKELGFPNDSINFKKKQHNNNEKFE